MTMGILSNKYNLSRDHAYRNIKQRLVHVFFINIPLLSAHKTMYSLKTCVFPYINPQHEFYKDGLPLPTLVQCTAMPISARISGSASVANIAISTDISAAVSNITTFAKIKQYFCAFSQTNRFYQFFFHVFSPPFSHKFSFAFSLMFINAQHSALNEL